MTAPRPVTAPPIDPRIRARRVAVAREAGRRRLRLLLVAAGLVAASGAGYATTRSPLLDVDTVRVAGTVQTPREDVLAAAGLERSRQLMDLDETGMARAVERLPWVAEATVRVRWPGTVAVSVTERPAVAAVPAVGGGWRLADPTGRLLAAAVDAPPGLPVVHGVEVDGPPGSSAAAGVGDALALVAGMPASVADRLAAVRVAGDQLELELTGGPRGAILQVRFGTTEAAAEKLLALDTLLRRADLRRVTSIDVRVPGAPTLTRT